MKNNIIKNQKYWEDRIILKDELLEKDISKIEKKLLKLFKDTRKEVLNELKIIYVDIESTEYAKYRIDSLLMSIDNTLDNLYKKNEEQVTEGLTNIYKEMDKEASIDLDASFNTINENLIREAIKTNWSGLSFSERIWEHRRRLAFTIKGELTKGLTRGDSLQDISRIIADKLNNSYSNALRLVRTESCWVMNEATINNYKNNGVKEYEFMAFLDKKTSPQCRELDGKIISVEEYKAGLNFPPLHPNCRSCIIPVTEDIVIEKPKDVDPIKALEDKGVKVDKSSFKNIDKKLFNENSKQLNRLFEKYPKAQEFVKNASFAFKAENLPSGVIAMCGNNFKSGASSINLDISNYKDYNKYIEQAKKNIKAGWNSKCIDKHLSVTSITHEFGHFIHNIIIDEYNKSNPTEFEKSYKSIMSANNSLAASKKKLQAYRYKIIKSCNKEIIKEAKKLDKTFNPKENIISKYGNSSPAEFFAECFAEYECDGTTIYAKAMEEFLRKRGFIK